MITKKELEKEIAKGIKKNVNGKIDKLQADQTLEHQKLHEQIQEIKASIQEVLDVFNDTSGFFRTSVKIAKWITVVGSAAGIILWGVNKIK